VPAANSGKRASHTDLNMKRPLICALLLTQALTIQASQAESPQEASARRFVQDFYNWYVPASAHAKGPAWDLATGSIRKGFRAKGKQWSFSPNLTKALHEDFLASSKNKGEIVGLDFDPFLNSQDPASRYVAQKVEQKGNKYFVSVHGVMAGKLAAKPDVIAQVEKQKGTWHFTNFIYPGNGHLLTVLKNLKRDRQKH